MADAPRTDVEVVKPLWRIWVRRGVLTLSGMATLLVIGAGLLVFMIHTGFGREQIRNQLVKQLNKVFVGEISIEQIEGSLLSEFSLVGIKISDSTGKDAVSLTRIDIGYRFLSLLDKTLAVEKLVLSGLSVSARRDAHGQWNLAQLVSIPEDDATEPFVWRIVAPRIRLQSSKIVCQDTGSSTKLENVELNAGLEFYGEDLGVTVERLSAEYLRHRLPGDASTRVRFPVLIRGVMQVTANGIIAKDLHMTAKDATLRVETFSLGTGGTLDLEAAVSIPAEMIRQFDPTIRILANLDANISVRRDEPRLPIAFAVDGVLGVSPISIAGTVAPESAKGNVHVEIRELNLAKIWEGLPLSEVAVKLNVSASGSDIATLSAKMDAVIDGRIDKANLGALKIEVGIDKGILTASMTPTQGRQWVDARATVSLDKRIVQSSAITVTHPAIESIAAGYLDVAGDIKLTAKASGGLDALTLTGELTSTRLFGFGNRVRRLKSRWQGRIGTRGYSGQFNVTAGGITVAGTSLGSLAVNVQSDRMNQFRVDLVSRGIRKSHLVDLKSEVIFRRDSVHIGIHTIVAATRGLTWRGAKGRIVVHKANKISVQNLLMRSTAGHLKIDGDILFDRGFRGELNVHARDIDLADLSRAIKLKPALEGTVSLRASAVKRSKKARADVRIGLLKVRAGSTMPTTSGNIRFRVDQRKVRVGAALATLGVGAIRAEVRAKGPRDPFALSEWWTLDRRALQSGSVTAQDLDLSAFSHLDNQLPRSGKVGLQATFGPVGKTATVAIAAKNLVFDMLVGEPVQAEIRASIDGRDVSISGNAEVKKRAKANLNLEARAPGPWLAPTTLSRVSEKHLTTAHFYVTEIDVDWWNRALSFTYDLYAAKADVKIVMEKGLRKVVASVQARQPGGGPRSNTAATKAEVVATITKRGTTIDASGLIGNKEVVTAAAQIASGWKDVANRGFESVMQSKTAANIEVKGFPLIALQDAFSSGDIRRSIQPRGRLVASVAVHGTVSDPTVTGTAHTQDAVLAGTEFLDFRFDGTYRRGRIRAEITGKQKPGGRLNLVANLGIAADPSLDCRFTAEQWDLGFLNHINPQRSVAGFLTGDVAAVGTVDKPVVTGSLGLRKVQVRPGAPLYPLRSVDLDVALSQTTLTLKGKARSGRGTVNITGTAAMRELLPKSLKLDVQTVDFPIEAGPFTILVDTRTSVRGGAREEKWNVGIDIGETIISVPGERSRTLHEEELPDDIVFCGLGNGCRSTPRIIVFVAVIIICDCPREGTGDHIHPRGAGADGCESRFAGQANKQIDPPRHRGDAGRVG